MAHHQIPLILTPEGTFIAPEPGKIYFMGTAADGDVVVIPEPYGTAADYFVMVSVPAAGIPDDSIFGDNGFSGYRGGYEAQKDRWVFRVASADNLERGATGGMGAVTVRTRNVLVGYCAIRITPPG